MSQEAYESKIKYKPVAYSNRFWIYPESGYTEEELNFRTWIINARTHSGIHPDYLTYPSSWFTNDEQALVNIHPNSLIFVNTYRPHHMLNRDDFHVQPINGQNLQWPYLYDLMQEVGDYLLLRNQQATNEHLNQPMNYVLLDINHMLRGLSQSSNMNQVQEQLELITRYVRSIEKNISPLVGSDRLFFANFRTTIDEKIQPMLTLKIESQILRDRLSDLAKNIRQLSNERNRVLHFALNANPVNPHPHEFSSNLIDNQEAFPTHAAKNCAQSSPELSINSSPLLLTQKELVHCPNFNLITNDEATLGRYAKAVTDLHELDRFQQVLTQVTDLLAQAGEVYTVHQFKTEMQSLFTQIEQFITDSSQVMDGIIQHNNHAYYRALDKKQNLPILKKYLTSEEKKLNNFIKNQDTLAQFPSSSADLSKTQKSIKGQVSDIINHLNQPQTTKTNFANIASQTRELNTIMSSMHHWIKNQHEIKGLELPTPPEPLKIPLLQEAITDGPMTNQYTNNSLCHPNEPCTNNNQTQIISPLAFFSFVTLIPVTAIFIYMLVKHLRTPTTNTESSKEYEKLKTELEDTLAQLEIKDELSTDEEYLILKERYQSVLRNEAKNSYNLEDLRELTEDLNDFQHDNTFYPQNL